MRSFKEVLPLAFICELFDTTAEEDFLEEFERKLRGNNGDYGRQDTNRDE